MRLQLRYNSGEVALMCSCGAVLANGYAHHEKTYTCPAGDCRKKWYVTHQLYYGDINGWEGELID